MTVFQQTTDASHVYKERTAAELASAQTAAQDGTVSSFIKNNTVVFSQTVVTPVFVPQTVQQIHPPSWKR